MSIAQLLREYSGAEPRYAAAAPGRVNLIGDHTDYSGGFALPMAVDLYTRAAAVPRNDDTIRIHSQAQGSTVIDLCVSPEKAGDWSDYLRGVVAGYRNRGVSIPGMDVVIGGDLPLGAGLSSSASLELCFAVLIEEATGKRLDLKSRSLLCQRAEHDYAGVPCGILDQFAVSFAEAGTAMLLDCGAQSVRRVNLPDACAIAIVDSGVRHALNDGAYARRRSQVEQAEQQMGKALRQSSTVDLQLLKNEDLGRRARHVISENQRVLDFAKALACGDIDHAGALMLASHRSLDKDFEVSCEELNFLVGAAVEGKAIGARMTGGGFGGSMVALVHHDDCQHFATHVIRRYDEAIGRTTRVRWVTPAAGAQAWSTTL